MREAKFNKDGTPRRTKSDNRVVKSGDKIFYKGNSIEFDSSLEKWLLNGQKLKNLSDLSQNLRGRVKEPQFNLTTYAIGEYLEDNGFIFTKPFRSHRPGSRINVYSGAEHSVDMDTVDGWSDIYSNIQRLEKYRISQDEDNEFYQELIKRGTCFVVTEINGEISFGPSRFIGYKNNTRDKHISNNNKDGRITNPEIEKITNSKFQINEGLERAYHNFCLSLGFTPKDKGSFGVIRKYISKNLPAIIPDDFLKDDLDDIQDQTSISETEKKQLVNARLGQGNFREALLAYWKGCSCSGLKEPTMLRASHIKPWRACNNEERLDHFNGLLLMPNLDLAFDNGLITFNKEGEIIISDILSNSDADLLGLKSNIRVKLNPRHQPYMQYHRENIFRK